MHTTGVIPIVLALFAAGCGDGDAAGSPAGTPAGGEGQGVSATTAGPAAGPTVGGTSSRGTFAFELTPLGGPIENGKPFDVTVAVTDPETGAPFTDFDGISLDARMPAHDHGMKVDIALVPTDEDGVLRADGLRFHMVGHWEFHVDVTRGSRMERAQASVTLEL